MDHKRGVELKKKGISPLIATVLLIAFVVILAALLFNFGRKFFVDTIEDTDARVNLKVSCLSTSISIHEIANKKQICYNGSDIVFKLVNEDMTEIKQVKLLAVGDLLTMNGNINLSLNASDISNPLFHPYDNSTYGNVTAIQIVPGILIDGDRKPTFCPGSEVTFEDKFRAC